MLLVVRYVHIYTTTAVTLLIIHIVIILLIVSRSLLTLDTTRRPMPFIQPSLACLEGNYMYIVKCCKHATCLLLHLVRHISYYTLTQTHTHIHTYIHMIAPNEFLPVQEKNTPLLKRGNLRTPKQYYHKSLNTDLKIMEVAHDNTTSEVTSLSVAVAV